MKASRLQNLKYTWRLGVHFFSCWVKADLLEAAKEKAENFIKKKNWIILTLETSHTATKKEYEVGHKYLENYLRAMLSSHI